jgi:hypothetical protein
VLIAGCAWSTFLVSRDVFVAPRESLVEQRSFAKQLDGRGPTLMLDYEGYSSRYLLGAAEVEGATDLRNNLVPGRNGEGFPDYTTVEVDDIQDSALYPYRILMRRQTPTGSRPPSTFNLLRDGEYFQAWARDPVAPNPLVHLNRSEGILPAAQVSCREVRDLAATAKATTLAAVARENPAIADIASGDIPPSWLTSNGVVPRTSGTAGVTLQVPAAGEYRVWVGGRALGELTVAVDGQEVGGVRHQLDASVGYMRFGVVDLEAGAHVITLAYERGAFWRAGRGTADAQLPLGPVSLSQTAQPAIERVPVADADRLCDGRTYDWLEALP